MHELLSSFLSNDSVFGKLMTRCGVVIGANVMFLFFSFPLVTAGAAYAALYHVMLKAIRGNGVINPFKQFWAGFKGNFKQATVVWLGFLALIGIGYLDLRIVSQSGGSLDFLRYPIYALGIVLVMVTLYVIPTMAAFSDTLPHLVRNSIYFMVKRPFRALVIAFFNLFPMYLTYSDPQTMPLYAFLWCTCGFGAIALLGAKLLEPLYHPYLPLVDEYGDFILGPDGEPLPGDFDGELDSAEYGDLAGMDESERQAFEDLKKLGM
jgi:uncharacterized membrane protein YesL